MRTVIGWIAILFALAAAVISIVPGAVSLMGIVISMLAVVMSLFSIKTNGCKYFGLTTGLSLAGVFLLNDTLRIWNPIPMPLKSRFGMASVVLFVLLICSIVAYRLNTNQCDPTQA